MTFPTLIIWAKALFFFEHLLLVVAKTGLKKYIRGKLVKFIADNMPGLIDQCLQIRSKLYDSKLKETVPSGPPCQKETNHQNFTKQNQDI